MNCVAHPAMGASGLIHRFASSVSQEFWRKRFMKKRVVLLFSTAAMAAVSLSAGAGMTDLADSRLAEVSGQGYTLTVGVTPHPVPFAYEDFVAEAPASVVTFQKALTAAWAPNYPTKVAATRTAGLALTNVGLTAATGKLQAIPHLGTWVPSVSITSP
jgi:hypothetical protein